MTWEKVDISVKNAFFFSFFFFVFFSFYLFKFFLVKILNSASSFSILSIFF